MAVKDLNLHIPQGEIFAFLGPNGAGKTTTIKLLTGLLKPTSGKVLIGGYDIQKDYIQGKKLIGYVSDRPFLYEKLTGREFLQFIGDLHGVEGTLLKKRREELLELFDLISYEDHLIEDYSHGMRQKLILCAALLPGPKVLIMDEPMVALDPRSARLLKDTLRKEASRGTTVFLSTHTLSLAEELAHRIGIIHRGNLVATGTREELNRRAHLEGKLEDIFLQLTEEEEVGDLENLKGKTPPR